MMRRRKRRRWRRRRSRRKRRRRSGRKGLKIKYYKIRGLFQKFYRLRFLYKNEFILQNTFTGLRCNLHCALSQRSNVWGKSCIAVRTPSLLMRLITRVTSSMLLKRFPRSGFFNFGNKSKAGGLMSGPYCGWGSVRHPYFSKISDTAPEARGRATLMYDRWSPSEI